MSAGTGSIPMELELVISNPPELKLEFELVTLELELDLELVYLELELKLELVTPVSKNKI